MNKLLLWFKIFSSILCLSIMVSCKTTSKINPTTKETSNELPIIYCNDKIDLIPSDEYDVRNLKSLNNLSFSSNYSILYPSAIDTLVKNKYRYQIADISDSIVKEYFPLIEINRNNILEKDYNHIASNTIYIHRKDILNKEKYIKKVLTSTEKSKQLLIVTKLQSNNWGTIHFYVLNNVNKQQLLYYDSYGFQCDVRDLESYEKILNYGLIKLIESTENK